jgi:hypothetical protein
MATQEKGMVDELEKGILPHEVLDLLGRDGKHKLGSRRRAGLGDLRLSDSLSYKVLSCPLPSAQEAIRNRN